MDIHSLIQAAKNTPVTTEQINKVRDRIIKDSEKDHNRVTQEFLNRVYKI